MNHCAALLSEARATADRASAAAAVSIRPLAAMDELVVAGGLFDQVWGLRPGEPSEIQPALLRALEHSGSYVVGAFDGAEMIAASVAFLAAPMGRGLHSHITGVLPERTGAGIGAALKWHQRAWSLERGIDTVSWTYDPLIARNAYFNIARLGARPREYLVDFYGMMTDELNAGQPSDRALAVWDLGSGATVSAARGERPIGSMDALVDSGAQVWLAADSDGAPILRQGPADRVLLTVPADVEALRRTDPVSALRWRLALRDALAPLIGDEGWRVVDFLRQGCYVLERSES